jgi:gluconate 2-dehydrogenase alpha chain
MLWRFLPQHFRYRSRHVERYGEAKLPDGSTLQDWPVGYHELEPYYDAFEWDLGTSGIAGNVRGEIREGGNPFEGPRSRPYPLPPLVSTMWQDRFHDACRRLGYSPFPQPSGILSEGYRDATGRTRSGCLYCGFCTRFGCEVDAKGSSITTHVPLAEATGRYEFRTGCYVTGVRTDRSGRATGVDYIGADGERHFQPADIVVLSGYTLTNVRLLLLSRSQAHPDGIGNDRGQVGKNATHQLFVGPAEGIFERPLRTYMANTSTMDVIFDWQADLFDHGDLDFIGGSMIYSSPGEREPISSAASFPLGASIPGASSTQGAGAGASGGGAAGGGAKPKSWGRDWKEALRRWDHYAAVRIQGDSLPYQQNRFDLDPVYTDRYGQPLLRFTFDWTDNERAHYRFLRDKCEEILRAMGPTEVHVHEELAPYTVAQYQSTHVTGGAIMGSGPGDSVTNGYGQVWDTPNVYVTGAALYPFNPGLNPTGTLAALAYRTGDAIAAAGDPTDLLG